MRGVRGGGGKKNAIEDFRRHLWIGDNDTEVSLALGDDRTRDLLVGKALKGKSSERQWARHAY